MSTAITVKDLRKSFGDIEALKGANFQVLPNEVFGLIGPNGAGKTTAIRILSTLIAPTSGLAEVFGLDVVKEPEKIRGMVSYLPEEAGAYPYLTGLEYLEFMAGFYSANREELNNIVQAGCEISGLGDRIKDRVNGYSRGMRRRLLIARSLMMRPKLAILDEPTSGLDVIQAVHVRQMIKTYAKEYGVTVLVSSHNMLEVEYLCDRVTLINKGIVVAEGTPSDLKIRFNASNLEQVFMEAAQIG
ncbi:MAG: ABC transporter ATP-binding protein [Candidatus Bathyarchaeota archaeon]|nr:ABC transporter ATP-binding protein [Candidatus Bathyarchaeota archaeon]